MCLSVSARSRTERVYRSLEEAITASLPWTSSTTSSSSGRPPGQRWVWTSQPAIAERLQSRIVLAVGAGRSDQYLGIVGPLRMLEGRISTWRRWSQASRLSRPCGCSPRERLEDALGGHRRHRGAVSTVTPATCAVRITLWSSLKRASVGGSFSRTSRPAPAICDRPAPYRARPRRSRRRAPC